MGFRKVKAVYKKEMIDLLRDKKTLIMMVLVPLILYPLIMIGAMLVTSAIANNIQTSEYDVVLLYEEVKARQSDFDREEFERFLTDTEDELEYHLNIVESDDPGKALLEEEIDALIVVEEADRPCFNVQYLSSVTNSSAASDMIENKLKLYSEFLEKKKLDELNMDTERIMKPIIVEWQDRSTKEESLGSILGSILPFLLIVSILMGAIYPAIDTTAGEKERGTLETLLTLPVRNDELIMGKFLAVATVAVVSALLNLLSMTFMGAYMYSLLAVADHDNTVVNLTEFIPAVLIVILCVVVFALFISALSMCVTTFAKSFKEANNYLTPLLLVVMFTGYIGFIPNIEFNSLMASVPVVNICLLISNILVFKYSFTTIIITLVTNVIYAALAVLLLSKLYNSEDILFGEGGVSLQIFTDRRELRKGGVPNFSDAVLVIAISMLLVLYAGSLLQMKYLMGGLLATQLMIIGVPVFFAWYTKKDIKETFSLKVPKISHVFGAVIMEIGVFAVVMVLSVGLTALWPEDARNVSDSFDILLEGVGFIPAALIMALAPAVCEEGLFRGYLFAASKKKFKPYTAMLIVAAVFGIYHLSLVKFFTTGILGFVFCYVVYRTGSIVTSSVMHFMNNMFSVATLFYGDQLARIMPILFKDTVTVSDVLLLLAAGILCLTAGNFLVCLGNNKKI
ncbi:MAG: ABC transporter permease subunit [Alistipes sp.]|nr:ABC transporter permease subunit [Alistipes sp.]